MLELVQLDKRISKEAYEAVYPELEAQLGAAQRAAREAGVPVVLVFEGWDAAGKGAIINRVTQAMDPRGFQVHAISAPDATERRYPWMWRFWRLLPTAGQFAVFDRSWYGRVLVAPMEGLIGKRQLEQAYHDIQQFERGLVETGVVILKFWLHIDKREQGKRFRKLAKHKATAWKVGKQEWRQHRRYNKWLQAVEAMLERTSIPEAPWTIVEATQARYARTKVLQTIVEAVGDAVERRAKKAEEPMVRIGTSPGRLQGPTILDRVDLSQSLDQEEYRRQLKQLQRRLFQLEHELYLAQVPVVIVYEGWDAAGKGGNIKRLTRGLDPRGYRVIPVGPPTEEEKTHHFLWRFWRHIPKTGHIAVFDRSWYGRVLVERVEGFCSEAQWRRAYREINEFERQLVDFGTVIVKFWLHIDSEEQLRRFRLREQDPHKQWKITEEDWRNRRKWDQYAAAVVDMLRQTSTSYAPWTILEANCKRFARIKALRTVADVLEKALDGHK